MLTTANATVGNWKIRRDIRGASSPLSESDDLLNTFPLLPQTLPTDRDMVTDYDLRGLVSSVAQNS
jgi:hypothetical protein